MSDLIDRQKAIEAIEEMQKTIMRSNFSHEQFVFRGMSEARQAIIDLPSVQPQTSTITIGRTKGETIMWYECDACGEPVDIKDNYCCNCGRRLLKDG